MANEQALRDDNRVPSLLVENAATGETKRLKDTDFSGDSPASAAGNGRKVVASAGTAEALAATTAIKSVVITAETDNTGIVVVGGSGVVASLSTREGTPLNAGDSISIDIDDLAEVYLDSTVNGEGVTYTYLT